VLIPPGRHFETLHISKAVTLRGSGLTDQSMLFGSIWVSSASGVTVDGISIYPLGAPSAGLHITSSTNVFIQNCAITRDWSNNFIVDTRNSSGIYVSRSSSVHFTNNILYGYGFGLYLDQCRDCAVQTCVFRDCWYALGVARSEGLKLVGNTFRENMAVLRLLEGGTRGKLVADGNVFKDNVEGIAGGKAAGDIGGFPFPQRGDLEPMTESERSATRVMVRGSCLERKMEDSRNPCVDVPGKS
jgi:parallel beta-helix repeat protein